MREWSAALAHLAVIFWPSPTRPVLADVSAAVMELAYSLIFSETGAGGTPEQREAMCRDVWALGQALDLTIRASTG
ncbi:hypothetical protein MF271_22035 (plasmid) [Deinococcus sp. KNUC1210]|uniref:hypothetical protein n=1 Tax=Deinococcus sp. KNUC1210 TaxID=2917691 RepID=UPI001EEF992E|nr:hypothetical protein [Deinococcus sp. KNUC1210]ULH18160.1 hypothetical protein MF271_22035 [Deinococcus sp. KNUC1210]